ncbi:MAG TPA: alkaline phosphatase family protein [Burkholderiaceae bacterium]
MNSIRAPRRAAYILTPVTLACALAACGGDGSTTTYSGKVVASAFKQNTSGDPALSAGYYAGATVFIDANGNGVKDSDETSTTTDANGRFTLNVSGGTSGQIVADIPTSATNTATGAAVPAHLILRASAAQITDQGKTAIVISPLSSELQRRVEANNSSYATEKANLATRLSGPSFNQGTAAVSAADVVADPGTLSGAEQYAVLYESNSLANRYTYATAKLDRGDKYPDALAVAGGDPRLKGVAGITAGETVPADTRPAITFAQAQQAAFNIEGVPAYDNIFVIVEENKSTDAILGNTTYAPYINQLLTKYDQLTTYYATGNPSEPNYTAVGGGDDWGISDDSWFGCGAMGAHAIQDAAFAGGTASDGQPLPATGALPPTDSAHLAGYSTTAGAACSTSPTTGTNHNLPGDNLFTLLSRAGLTARTYSESMNPGQDVRSDSVADAAVVDTYSQTDVDGTTVTGTTNYPIPGGLYKIKHGPSMAYQSARSLPEFFADNRTIFGTQYTEADWLKSTAYPVPGGWIYDQFGKDLANGDVGNINFVVPDQCDDMHGVGSDASCKNANDGQTPGIKRADIYVNKVVTAIQNSALWKNPQRHVAIVIMFDEGEGSSTACCGWNAGGKTSGDAPVTVDSTGKATATTQPTGYGNGNIGHGNSIFAVITNQQDVGTAPKGVKDSDAYSHFSFVRTLQDMFQLADPAVDATYLNRAKYTEAFIAANITALPEFAGSADTHFDSVRPINHAYVIPAGYVQKLNPADIGAIASGPAVPVQTGPDANQTNVWTVN